MSNSSRHIRHPLVYQTQHKILANQLLEIISTQENSLTDRDANRVRKVFINSVLLSIMINTVSTRYYYYSDVY